MSSGLISSGLLKGTIANTFSSPNAVIQAEDISCNTNGNSKLSNVLL